MEKNVMNDVKNSQMEIHARVGEMTELQKIYGLRICSISIGYATEKNSYINCKCRKFEFYSISCAWDGGGKFWTEETGEIEVTAPSFVMVAPGVINRYGGANGKSYVEDAITFYGPAADKLHQLGVFKTGVFPSAVLRRLPDIQKNFQNPAHQSQLNALCQLQNLIFEIYNERLNGKIKKNFIGKILQEIEKNIDKWYQVEELAEMAEMSLSTFRRKFLQTTGVLPKRYIEELKIHHAAKDLISSDKKISRIAAYYGYFDPYHFSRRFKKVMGYSPEQYRMTFAGK